MTPSTEVKTTTAMRFVLNPSTTDAMTHRCVSWTHHLFTWNGAVPLTATKGVSSIVMRVGAQIGSAVALELLADYHRRVDAAIIVAFGYPGLLGARELFEIPIVGTA